MVSVHDSSSPSRSASSDPDSAIDVSMQPIDEYLIKMKRCVNRMQRRREQDAECDRFWVKLKSKFTTN